MSPFASIDRPNPPAALVIIGSGLAGYTVAREFRKLDRDTPVTLITADDGGYYSKPMLSNALAQGKSAAQLLNTTGIGMAAQLNLRLVSHAHVTAIDTAGQRVKTAEGEHAYTSLVLALGADPIRLALAGDAAARVHSVNHLRDYAGFRAALEGKRSVVIFGAGLIGCEFANDLAGAGIAVRVIDPAAAPMASLLPPAIGNALAERLHAQGVHWHFGRTAARVDHSDAGYQVTLDDGSQLTADLVLSAVGLRPRVQMAAAAGITVERGIVVDRFLRSSAPQVYALGDCAQYEGRVLPYVLPIMNAARALGASLAGTPTPVVFPAMPVVVKTPALPIVVCPPAPGAAGAWNALSAEDGTRMTFEDESGRLAGFALCGARTAERAALAKRMA